MKTHKDLEAWQKSMTLVTNIYGITRDYPRKEDYGITSQIRRAVVSIPSNIAEGSARNTKKEYIQFLYIALGSISELETLLLISENLQYIEKSDTHITELTYIKKLVPGLIRYLKREL